MRTGKNKWGERIEAYGELNLSLFTLHLGLDFSGMLLKCLKQSTEIYGQKSLKRSIVYIRKNNFY